MPDSSHDMNPGKNNGIVMAWHLVGILPCSSLVGPSCPTIEFAQMNQSQKRDLKSLHALTSGDSPPISLMQRILHHLNSASLSHYLPLR